MGEFQHISQKRSILRSGVQAATTSQAVVQHRLDSESTTPPSAFLMGSRLFQLRLAVGAADDTFEREAEHAADAVIAAPGWSPRVVGGLASSVSLTPVARRAVGKQEPSTKKDEDEKPKRVQKAASMPVGPEVAPAEIESGIQSMSRGGQALPLGLRAQLEPGFGYDFSEVRTHTDNEAAGAALSLGARAFTVGDHIFFAAGEFQPATAPGRHLIAHELAHTVQQKSETARPARVQRDWFPDPKQAALNKISQWANELPPFELLTVLLGRNPITDQPVERNARNFIHAALRLVPDGMAIFDDLEKNKTIEKTAAWFDAEVTKLNLTWDGIKALFKQAWDAIDLPDFLTPSKVWEKVKAIFGPTLKRIADFAINVGAKILDFIKKAVLEKLGAWAKKQKGYSLLTFILGKDPVTDEPVERSAKNFVRAVLDLVPGGDQIFANLEKSKTIEKTVAWLDEEIKKLDLSWEKIKSLFRKAWDEFKVADLLHPLTLIEKIAGIFLPPAERVARFALEVGKKVLEFIFEGAMMLAGPIGMQIVRIFQKIGDTFHKIVENPVGFVGNLVKAVKQGFDQFGKNIWEHLKTGVIEWLVGALEGAGLILPKVWDLKGILDLALQVLGITYAKMRAKLVKVIGEERVAMLERVFAFLKALVTEGPAAAWQQIVEAIGSFWDLVIGGIKDWAITKIIKMAIVKIASMLNPAGAVIQAIIAIYNTVAFFVERIKQILALVEAIVDSIANIAAGKLSDAANFVERAMARTIPVIIGFLASLIGLGDISDGIKKVIAAIQEKVDKAIDAAIAWIVDKAKSLLGIKDKPEEPHDDKWATAVSAVKGELAKLEDAGELDEGKLEALLPTWQQAYGFAELKVDKGPQGRSLSGSMSASKKLTEGHLGTDDDPFPLTYPKPKDAYSVLYFGERTGATRTQKFLQEAYGDTQKREGLSVRKYVPFPSGGQALPDGTEIGIRSPFALRIGDKIWLSDATTPGGGKINYQLEKYGYNARDAGGNELQGDHYQEIQFGGEDVLDNLWPLERGLNNASGNELKNLSVTFPSGRTKKASELKAASKKYRFVITGFRRPS